MFVTFQESSPLLIHDSDTFAAAAGISCSNVAVVAAQPAARKLLPEALERKPDQQTPIDRRKLDVTSSTRDRDRGPQRFWSPSLERRRDNARLTAWASMFDFRSHEVPDFRSKLSLSPESSEVEMAEADPAATARKKSIVARHCTRQLCCVYFRKFVAFLFSTVGSCCLMTSTD